MKNFRRMLWVVVLCLALYYQYKFSIDIKSVVQPELLRKIFSFGVVSFTAGMAFVAVVYGFMFSKVTDSVNQYKRELEKASINKNESNSKVKVLESKIEVLEKALDEALKK